MTLGCERLDTRAADAYKSKLSGDKKTVGNHQRDHQKYLESCRENGWGLENRVCFSGGKEEKSQTSGVVHVQKGSNKESADSRNLLNSQPHIGRIFMGKL